jgi:ribosomal protein L18E
MPQPPKKRAQRRLAATPTTRPGDTVIVSNEAIPAALIENRLIIAGALDFGLVAIAGVREVGGAVRTAVT